MDTTFIQCFVSPVKSGILGELGHFLVMWIWLPAFNIPQQFLLTVYTVLFCGSCINKMTAKNLIGVSLQPSGDVAKREHSQKYTIEIILEDPQILAFLLYMCFTKETLIFVILLLFAKISQHFSNFVYPINWRNWN